MKGTHVGLALLKSSSHMVSFLNLEHMYRFAVQHGGTRDLGLDSRLNGIMALNPEPLNAIPSLISISFILVLFGVESSVALLANWRVYVLRALM